MQTVEYPVKHMYQPTNSSCSQTALAILLSYFDIKTTPEELLSKVPQVKDAAGKDSGTINQQLATWCVRQGFSVTLYTFDCQIIDQSWAQFSKDKIIERLEAGKRGWEVPSLGSL